MTRATITHTKTPRRAHPAVLRAALRTHNRNDTESGRVAAQQRGTHRPTPCGYNRLIEVHDAANAIIATYRYDPFGRRLSKTLTTTTGQGSSTYYFYSAEGLIAEADSNGQIIQSYGYAPGSTFTTNPLWTKLSTAGTATYYTYQNDHLGTPQKLLNQSGITVWSATYDAFGRATIDPASTITNNLRFPGQYADQETGLHYNWMRFYDPTTGRYVTSDPIGLYGGINTYTYVGGMPMNGIDPVGLAVGHHVVPQSIYGNAGLPADVAAIFNSAVTGTIPGGHNYGGGHSDYNKAVKEKWDAWLRDSKINPSKMTKKQAVDFTNQVLSCTDPRIAKFNKRIYEKILIDRMKKVALKRSLGPLATVWFMVTADTLQEATEEFIDGLVWGVDEVQ